MSGEENNLKEILLSLVESKKVIDDKINKLPPRVNLFRSLNREEDEVTNSMVLHSVLKINRGGINISQLFVEYLKNYFSWNSLESSKTIDVERETPTSEGRRIDLLLYSKNNFAIIIENKIDAGDQDNQLNDYYKEMIKRGFNQKNIYVLYLTRDGHEPADYSLSEDNRKKIHENFQCIPHSFIADFLEDVLTNKKEILDSENFQILKSAIIQVVENQKYLSGKTEAQNIMKEELKKVIDKKEFENEDEINEYIEMFNISVIILKEIKVDVRIKFYSKVAKYLEGSNFYIEDKDAVKEQLLKQSFSHSIHFYAKKKENIIIILEMRMGENSILGIYDSRSGHREKLLEIKEKVNSILTNMTEKKTVDGFIFYENININKDKPKDIANKMIALYDLLKKEGF